MAAGFKALDMLNQRTKASVTDETPRAKFRTKDLSVFKIYANTGNFYPQENIEQKAGEILAVGMLENLVVKYEPLETVGEYKLISGERRWRALRLLVERGYKEFEFATCNIVSPASLQEERVALIIANSCRNKSIETMLHEERELKEVLEDMRDRGVELKGYSLQSGRLRDVIADLLNISRTKVAQIESVNNNLIPEFMEELNKNRLTFSAAYELSGMPAEEQQKALSVMEEGGELPYQIIKSMKKKTVSESDTGKDRQEDGVAETQTAAADSVAETQQTADTRIRIESEKTEEQRYSEEQDRIDRETARKLREMADKEKMEELPSDRRGDAKTVHRLKIGASHFKDVKSGQKTFELRKNDKNFKKGDILELMEYVSGAYTGQLLKAIVTYVLEDYTGIEEGYCIMAVKVVENEPQ